MYGVGCFVLYRNYAEWLEEIQKISAEFVILGTVHGKFFKAGIIDN